MPHYKDINGGLHFLDDEIFAYLLPDGSVKITDKEAEALRPAPSQSEIIASYESALDKHLDSVAQRYRYADRTRLALRASYPNEDQALAVAFGTWMDQQCNRPAKQLMQDVIAGIKPQPTLEEFLASLPEFVAP